MGEFEDQCAGSFADLALSSLLPHLHPLQRRPEPARTASGRPRVRQALLIAIGAWPDSAQALPGGRARFVVPIMVLFQFSPLTAIGASQVIQIIAAVSGTWQFSIRSNRLPDRCAGRAVRSPRRLFWCTDRARGECSIAARFVGGLCILLAPDLTVRVGWHPVASRGSASVPAGRCRHEMAWSTDSGGGCLGKENQRSAIRPANCTMKAAQSKRGRRVAMPRASSTREARPEGGTAFDGAQKGRDRRGRTRAC